MLKRILIITSVLLVLTVLVTLVYAGLDAADGYIINTIGIEFETGTPGSGYEVWLVPPDTSADYTFMLPSSISGMDGLFMSVSGNQIVFISTAAYDGDIQSVWDDTVGDVGDLDAASGDTLDATLADSTIPWKVDILGTPTVEGESIWDSDDDWLAIGDGASTLYVDMKNTPTPTAAWEADGNDDFMPITGSFDDVYWDTDSNGDIMPILYVHFALDTNNDLMPLE